MDKKIIINLIGIILFNNFNSYTVEYNDEINNDDQMFINLNPSIGILSLQKPLEQIICNTEIVNKNTTNLINQLKINYPDLFSNNKIIFSLPFENFFNDDIKNIIKILLNFYNQLNGVCLDYNCEKFKVIGFIEKTKQELQIFPDYSVEFWPGNGMGQYHFERKSIKNHNHEYGYITSVPYLSGIIKTNIQNIINFYFRDNGMSIEYNINEDLNGKINFLNRKIISIEYILNNGKENNNYLIAFKFFDDDNNKLDGIELFINNQKEKYYIKLDEDDFSRIYKLINYIKNFFDIFD